MQPSSFLFLPIGEDTSNARSGKISPVSGRNTPTVHDAANAAVKPAFKGQEKGAVAYSVEDHVAVLQLMLTQPKSFDASESSEEWRDLYQQMCKDYYIPSGNNPRSSFTLHGHLVEMYGAFKKAFRNLSLLPDALKCPTSYATATDDEVKEFLDSLLNYINTLDRSLVETLNS